MQLPVTDTLSRKFECTVMEENINAFGKTVTIYKMEI